GFDQLLDDYPPSEPYVARARKLLEPWEAPLLLKQCKQLLDPGLSDKDRDEAQSALTLLLKRYPDTDAAREAQVVVAEQEVRELLRKKKAGQVLPGEVNRAKDLAVDAMELEEANRTEEARAKWQEITRLSKDNSAFAPWIALAEDRLARDKK